MSNWTPTYKVIVDGTNLANVVLVGLTIQTGRSNVYNQPQAGYCAIQIINLDGTNYEINVGSSLTIEVTDSSGDYVPLFGGKVSDVTNAVNSTGAASIVTRLDILAIGSISKLYKATWENALSQDDDGDQIYTILSDLLLNTWNEVSASQQWQNYNATETWANAQNVGLGEIDQPGQYEMEQRAADPVDFYSLIAQIANSALGYIYEDSNGNIGYASATHRQNYLSLNGYVELDATHAIAPGIRTISSSGTIVNKYILNYGNNFNSQKQSLDQASIDLYGLYSANVYSSIHNPTDAQTVADRQVQLRAYPRPLFDSITFALQNPELDDGDRDALLNIFMGMPVKIINLPPTLGTEFTGYVEGWSLRSTVSGLTVTFNASPTDFSAIAQNWDQVSILEQWNTLSNTLQWEDAIGVIS